MYYCLKLKISEFVLIIFNDIVDGDKNMATTTQITLTDSQKEDISKNLRIGKDKVPNAISIVAIAPEAGSSIGIPEDQHSAFSPALIVT